MNLKVGDFIKAQKITRTRDYCNFPVNTQYSAENFEGRIIKIRDLSKDELNIKTVEREPFYERSRYLITIKTKSGLSNAYHGCLINIELL